MKIRWIQNKEELDYIIPQIIKLSKECTICDPELTDQEFMEGIVDAYNNQGILYYDQDDEGVPLYAILLRVVDQRTLEFVILYVGKATRKFTKELVTSIMDLTRQSGFKKIEFTTHNLKPSYHRWLKKFKVKQVSVGYEVTL